MQTRIKKPFLWLGAPIHECILTAVCDEFKPRLHFYRRFVKSASQLPIGVNAQLIEQSVRFENR